LQATVIHKTLIMLHSVLTRKLFRDFLQESRIPFEVRGWREWRGRTWFGMKKANKKLIKSNQNQITNNLPESLHPPRTLSMFHIYADFLGDLLCTLLTELFSNDVQEERWNNIPMQCSIYSYIYKYYINNASKYQTDFKSMNSWIPNEISEALSLSFEGKAYLKCILFWIGETTSEITRISVFLWNLDLCFPFVSM